MNTHIQKNTIPLTSSLNKIFKIFKFKTLEEELEQSKNDLSIALQDREYGKWDWNMIANEIDISPDLQAILGYDKKRKILEQNAFLRRIHPEDQSIFFDEIENHKRGDVDFVSVDIRMKSAYGHWNWINIRGKIVEFDKSGSPKRFSGINYDINEQKQYDNDVQELQQEVIKSHEENTKSKNISYIDNNLDRYSEFRLNGLKNLLDYN